MAGRRTSGPFYSDVTGSVESSRSKSNSRISCNTNNMFMYPTTFHVCSRTTGIRKMGSVSTFCFSHKVTS
jgi:hypothetical protein